jgi:hypothetical protein
MEAGVFDAWLWASVTETDGWRIVVEDFRLRAWPAACCARRMGLALSRLSDLAVL